MMVSRIRYILYLYCYPDFAVLMILEQGSRTVPASESVLCFGGSLVSIESYRNLVLHALKQGGHVFRHVEVVDDAAAAGARGLVASWEET